MKVILIVLAVLGFMANVYFAFFHGSAWAGMGAGLMVAAVFVEPAIKITRYEQGYDN
ncbi:hypothetical protein [Psychrobacter sp. 16-MNA-CIBAN-0192]|uniref:hypothetical protein n=1 Tax=Psychrobacter sp. 16-MNA-CIBAN-0192 TaxID=3140448 RepID=UPI00332F7A8F